MKDLKFEVPTYIEEISKDGNQASFVIKPLSRGYGVTIGNALRRVLLSSSMPGSAIVNCKINGVEHEFQTIDGVYEDVVGIILNLKEVVINVDSQDPDFEQELEILKVGPGKVTAGDFSKVTGVNIINPDQVICNLAEDTTFHLLATVKNGNGYKTANQNKIHAGNRVGLISIDSLFSPVTKVSYNVDKIRGDDDLLNLTIETNGAMNAKDCLGIAAKMLMDYLDIIVGISEKVPEDSFIYQEEEKEEDELLDKNIEELDLTVRLFNALKRSGIIKIRDLVNLTEDEALQIRALGEKSFRELKEKLAENNLSFKNSSPEKN